MAFCFNCGNQLADNSQFCDQCGTRVQKKENICTTCGNVLEDGQNFCSECGTRAVGTVMPNTKEVQPPVSPTSQYPSQPAGYQANEPAINTINGAECELYRRNMIAYFTKLKQITGTLLVTNKKIAFTPTAIYVFSKPITVYMNEVTYVERTRVLGMNNAMCVKTVSGESYSFNFGVAYAKEIQPLIDMINSNKQRV